MAGAVVSGFLGFLVRLVWKPGCLGLKQTQWVFMQVDHTIFAGLCSASSKDRSSEATSKSSWPILRTLLKEARDEKEKVDESIRKKEAEESQAEPGLMQDGHINKRGHTKDRAGGHAMTCPPLKKSSR